MSKKLDYPLGKGIATFNIGNSYYFKADIKNALTNYLAALRMLEPFEPSKDIGNLLLQLGAVNQYVRNTGKVTAYYKRAASNFAAIGDSAATMWAYVTLAGSYFYELEILVSIGSQLHTATINAMMDSALLYNGKILDYRTRHPDSAWMPDLYNFQALYLRAKNDSSALDYFLKSLEAGSLFADSIGYTGLAHLNLGGYYRTVMYDQDLAYYHSILAADIFKKTDRYDLYGSAIVSLGEFEADRGHYPRAKQYLLRGLNIIDTFLVKIGQIVHDDPAFRIWGVTQARATRIATLIDLVKLYELTGDYKQALVYQQKLEEEKSIQSLDELTRQIIGLEADNEDQLKRQEIAGLTRDNELRRLKMNQTKILFAGLGGAVLIAFLVFMVWIQRKRFRSDQKAMLLEQKLLRSQMNPHFIFNSLTNIQNFILTEKPDKANIYLSKFAMLVRNILDNSVEEYVILDKEISTLENYLELQKMRYSGKLDYRIHIADEIDIDSIKIPPMLAQPFIENAIEHGIKHRETPGHIDIRFSLKDSLLVFEVEDDGIGRQKAREIAILNDPQHKSMATSLTRERLANLNRKLKEKIQLEIIDLKNALREATGTKVMFGIPVK